MKSNGKIKKAAAISYSSDDAAPKVTAAGKGFIAEEIIKTAQEKEIPIYKDSTLADTLLNIELGKEIPPELYNVIAEILVFVCHIDKKRGETVGWK